MSGSTYRWIGAFMFALFAAWHIYRAIRATKSGIFESFDQFDRASDPQAFRLAVWRQLLLGLLLTGMSVSVLLGLGMLVDISLFVVWLVFYAVLLARVAFGAQRTAKDK